MNSNDSLGETIPVRDFAPMELDRDLSQEIASRFRRLIQSDCDRRISVSPGLSITTPLSLLNSMGAANGLSWLARLIVLSTIGFLIGVNSACTQTAASTEGTAKPTAANTALISLPINEPNAAIAAQNISYEVGRVIRNSNEPHEVTVIISVDPQHFNRDDMVRLASQLKTDFPNAPILSGEILDDRNIADNYVPAGDMYRLFYKARRAFYSLNRKTGKEYIEFSSARGKPFNEIKVNLSKGH